MRADRCVDAAMSDTGAAEAATSEIVMIKRYGGPVLQSIVVCCVSTSDLLCQNRDSGDLLRGGHMERLDATDELILAELAEDARATYAEIGGRVNLSAPAVKRRVDRMLDSGVIRGFTTVVDRNALGWNTEAYVQVFRHGTVAPDELRKAWIDIPDVVSAATVTGTADAILHVLARDMRHLEEALERIRSAADVERSESIVVLTNVIDRMRG
jgi:DNA-binding Lrp family transcriptional regulator